MSKLNDKLFRDLLSEVESGMHNNVIFFRVPFVEGNVLEEIKTAINDILFVKALSVPPFSRGEIIKYAISEIKKKKYIISPEAIDLFEHRIAEEKNDGRFYGLRTVEKVVAEIIYLKVLSNVTSNTSDTLITADDIADVASDVNSISEGGLDDLNNMVGMSEIRKRIEEIVAQIELSRLNPSLDSPCIHMRFTGNPGTGKTTVARILGKVLKQKGILRNGDFFEYSGRDLCGRYVGETAPKTAAICRDAYGSVLFIDEAYALYRGDNFSRADYGMEAIDTLIAEMENHRNDLVVIMAGYTEEMEQLMEANSGLKSRMPFTIEFKNYTRDELAEIYINMASGSFEIDDEFKNTVKKYFAELSDEKIGAKDFSNARYIRNLYERTWGKASVRCQLSGEACTKLTVEDFGLAVSDKEFQNIVKKKTRPIGFI